MRKKMLMFQSSEMSRAEFNFRSKISKTRLLSIFLPKTEMRKKMRNTKLIGNHLRS